jgi:putative proteasome-type protease
VVEIPGERVIVLLSAGNLAVTQSIINIVTEGNGEDDDTALTLANVPSMFRAARLLGHAVREVYETDGKSMEEHGVSFDVSFLLAGQIKGRRMRLFQVYAAGNFIEATTDTPYMQIGERNYGKPILDRGVSYDISLEQGVKLALISMDSTLRSNLSVGLPMDILTYRADSEEIATRYRITEEDPDFRLIRDTWSEALRQTMQDIPAPKWLK